jgi:hypothetical protein
MLSKSHTTISFAALCLFSTSYANLDKPVINPQFYDSIDPKLQDVLKAPSYQINQYQDGSYIPTDCKNMAAQETPALSAADIEAFDVKYDDCSDAWTLCRHKDAPNSQKDMAEHFGKLPVRMRSYIRHIISVPGTASAYNSANNILIRAGPSPMTIYGHETGHSLDADAFANYPNGFSESQTWTDAYNADPNVCQDYAQASQQENLAQMINVAIFDQNVDGGISTIAPNWENIKNQLKAVNDNIGTTLKPGGQCVNRLQNSAPVKKDGSSKFLAFARNANGRVPDVSLSPHLKVIKPRDVHSKHETFFDENWKPILPQEQN